MRKSKLLAQQKARDRVKQHTKPERLAMRRHKRKHGPSALRRQERRKHLQPKRQSEDQA